MALVLPNYIPIPERANNLGLTPRSTLNSTASKEQTFAVAGAGAVLPDAYGRVQVVAKIPTVVEYNNQLLVVAVWGAGEWDAIEEVRSGDDVITDATHYLGTDAQSVDADLVAAIPGFTDAMPGVAYSVLKLNASEVRQRIIATVRGRKVYDPRTPGTAWSENPSLMLADYMARVMGRTVDWDSVETCADANDELLADSSKRREIGLLMDRRADHQSWLDTLAEYAGVFYQFDSAVVLVPNRPRATDHVITESLIRDIKVSKRGMDNTPNRVTVWYTDTSGDTWRQVPAATDVIPGEPVLNSDVRLPGFKSYASAMRVAQERVNAYLVSDLDVELVLFDEGLKVRAGDLLAVTHNIGLSNKLMRVLHADAIEPGRWRVITSEYDPVVYSDVTPSGPSLVDTNLPDPLAVPDGPVPVPVEEVYQLQNGNYATRLRITWPVVSNYPFDHEYRVRVESSGTLIWSATTADLEFVTGAVQESVTYTVYVSVVGFGAATGNASSAQIIAQGKQLPPGDVPFITAIEVGGEVRVRWDAAVDVDIWRYEVRYSGTGGDWDSATLIDRVDSLRLLANELPPGDWIIYVKALDSVGNYSDNAASTPVTVTLDAGAFLQGESNLGIDAGDSSNMVDTGTGYVTNMGETWDSLFTANMDTYTNPLFTYHASGTSEWVSDALDLTTVASGTWQAQVWAEALSGTYDVDLELSDDAISWTAYNQLSVNGTARYARVRITATGSSTVFVTTPYAHIRCDVIPREETGTVTTNASGAKTVTLSGTYSKVVSINLQPSGTAPRTAVYDNVQLGDPSEFDAYLFDGSQSQIAGDVSWSFKGV